MAAPHWSTQFDEILRRHLPLADGVVDPDASLAELGLDSLGTVSLVVDLEEGLGIAIPDEILLPDTFASTAALHTAVAGLIEQSAAR